MADGHLGPRSESASPYSKIFTGFRIALDIKKLLLAATGIFVTALGWWLLSWLFYTPNLPQWNQYEGGSDNPKAAWTRFKRDRDRWNLLHRLAGPPGAEVRIDAGDVAQGPAEFRELQAAADSRKLVEVDVEGSRFSLDRTPYAFKVVNEGDADLLRKTPRIPFVDVRIVDDAEQVLGLGKVHVRIVEGSFGDLKKQLELVRTAGPLSPSAQEKFVRFLEKPPIKPTGFFRVCPWSEDRGENPYLLVDHLLHGDRLPFERSGLVSWLVHDELKVLLEPLYKFLSPVYYLFHADAGGMRNSSYLLLVVLWNLAVWGYLAGALTRLAAVQIARNEKAPLGETLGFVNRKFKHYFLAPLFPLLCLFVLALILAAFGFIEGWTFFFGDIVMTALLFPIVIVLGLIMAVLLLGLFGWPLMYPTISAEGSDAFDALSRSYSYFYQAPWRYLGYSALALAYGIAIIFFVGYMGSLMVYLGKWGLSQAPALASHDPTRDRTPVYLFQYAPTSFGWRDLFLHDSDWAEVDPAGALPGRPHWRLQPDYVNALSIPNRIGSWLVGFWIGLVFLLVLGFGYSYFWTASTILYFLMRRQVDDTEYDEIHMEEDLSQPALRDSAPPPPAPAPATKPNTISLNVVEPPPASPTTPSVATAPPPVATPAPVAPVAPTPVVPEAAPPQKPDSPPTP